MDTIELNVPTVHCPSCKLNIEETLEELPGVDDSDVDIDAKRVTVSFDPVIVTPSAIGAAVEEAGYPVAD